MDIEAEDTVVLVRQAQLGLRWSMGCLAERARQRLYAYVYRLTLNQDLAQDQLQETLLKMVQHISEVKHPERFWAWLFRTALGNVQHYYRDEAKREGITFSALMRQRMGEYLSGDYDDGLDRAIRREMSRAIVKAMARLPFSYRHVLMLRCFEQMSFAEIAEMMDCTELHARVLFFRARNSLGRQLRQRGFDEDLLVQQ